MAYIKSNRTPLMFGGPTPYNRPPAMAGCCGSMGDETLEVAPFVGGNSPSIEMDAEFVGKPAPVPNVFGALFSGVANTFGLVADAVAKPFASSPPGAQNMVGSAASAHNTTKDKLLAAGPMLLLLGAGAYFVFKKRS